jgi:hypothetical protein
MRTRVFVAAAALWLGCICVGAGWNGIQRYLAWRRVPAGQHEVQRLQDFYNAALYSETIQECNRAEYDVRYQPYRPQICYIRWVAQQTLGNIREADNDMGIFLATFPSNPLAAEMHYSKAMKALANNNRRVAETELRLILDKFRSTKTAAKAKACLTEIDYAQEPASYNK